MKKIVKWIGFITVIIFVFIIALKIIEYNSLVSKNTRHLELILSENITSGKDGANRNVKNLISLNYDKMYVFDPYQSLGEMEKQIGFKYAKLEQGLSEGIINILFVNDNRPVAYLFGHSSNTGYYIQITSGEYTKAQIDSMSYTVEERQVGNSYGTPKAYINYQFKD